MSQNSSLSIISLPLKATQESQPAPPPWFAQATILATWFWKTGLTLAIQKNVRVPRGRSGEFTTTDFLFTVPLSPSGPSSSGISSNMDLKSP